MTLNFQVTGGGSLDIDVKITGPTDDVVVFTKQRDDAEMFTFAAPGAGTYQFCFSNAFSTVTAKQVGFTITVGDALTTNDLAKQEHLTALENSIMQVSEGLATIQNEQSFMRSRERAHRNTTENTNQAVLYWSIFEAVVLLAMSFGQIFYIKKSFESKSKV